MGAHALGTVLRYGALAAWWENSAEPHLPVRLRGRLVADRDVDDGIEMGM